MSCLYRHKRKITFVILGSNVIFGNICSGLFRHYYFAFDVSPCLGNINLHVTCPSLISTCNNRVCVNRMYLTEKLVTTCTIAATPCWGFKCLQTVDSRCVIGNKSVIVYWRYHDYFFFFFCRRGWFVSGCVVNVRNLCEFSRMKENLKKIVTLSNVWL